MFCVEIVRGFAICEHSLFSINEETGVFKGPRIYKEVQQKFLWSQGSVIIFSSLVGGALGWVRPGTGPGSQGQGTRGTGTQGAQYGIGNWELEPGTDHQGWGPR